MAVSIDVGTMFLVKGEIDEIEQGPAFTVQRNCFLQVGNETEDVLKENKWTYAKYDNQFFILGEDALKLKNLLTLKSKPEDANIVLTKTGDLRRPMKDGILNTAEEKLSIAMIQKLLADLVGTPKTQGEILCFCAPGDPVDKDLTTVLHKTLLTNLFSGMGYTVECVPEALAIIFSEMPVADDPMEPDGKAEFSGISFSFGAGMCNVCFAWKRIPLINFSVAKSGDFIDRETAKIAGVDVSAVTAYKEKNFDLDKVDPSDMRSVGLDVFYQVMIQNALNNFAEKFNKLTNKIETPLEIVVAGGTSMVPGFLNKFNTVLSSLTLPFKVKSVRMAKNPFYAVSNGCLNKALSLEQKKATGNA